MNHYVSMNFMGSLAFTRNGLEKLKVKFAAIVVHFQSYRDVYIV